MNFQVEKASFLNQYPDKETPAQAFDDESIRKNKESDPLSPISGDAECGKCSKEFTNEEILSLVLKCANFAAEKHSKQRRKDVDETPYINHPIGVANILINEGGVYDPVVILSALLHDTVEDTETTFDEIEKDFGNTVAKVVAEVTDDKSLPKDERKRLQIFNSKDRSHQAKLVTLADKIYNLRDIQTKGPPVGWSDTRTREYFQWSKKVIDNCRGTNIILENIFDIIFAKQCKDAKNNCNCIEKKKIITITM